MKNDEQVVIDFLQSVPLPEMDQRNWDRVESVIRRAERTYNRRSYKRVKTVTAATAGVVAAGVITYAGLHGMDFHIPVGRQHDTSAANITESKVQVPTPTTPVSSSDKSNIKLLKQKTNFKGKLPAFLPSGYGKYTARLLTLPNHQVLALGYPGPPKNQWFQVTEFPYTVPKNIPSNSRIGTPNNLKYMTVDGTKVTIVNPQSKLRQYDFLKNGLLFEVISSDNSSNDAIKFVKSIIDGGTPWN